MENEVKNINIKAIDYKDTELLTRFINAHGRIFSRRQTHLSAKHQRKIATAIKRARFLGLLPFVAK
jgi:small subunit ribosomal protein S18